MSEGIINITNTGANRYRYTTDNGNALVVASALGVDFARSTGSGILTVPAEVEFLHNVEFDLDQSTDANQTSTYTLNIVSSDFTDITDGPVPIIQTFQYISPTQIIQQYDDTWEMRVDTPGTLTIEFPNMFPITGTVKTVKIIHQ